MSERQPAFTPGEAVQLRLLTEPWFGPGTFLGYEADPFDEQRLVYQVRDEEGHETIVPPLFVHRDGPEFRAWRTTALALRVAEESGQQTFAHAEWEKTRVTASAAARRLFAVHPQGVSLGLDR